MSASQTSFVLPCVCLFAICECHLTYFALFRSPPIFGLDLSPILAFFLLNVLTNATAALGAEATPEMQKKLQKSQYAPFAVTYQNPNTKKIEQHAAPTLGDL